MQNTLRRLSSLMVVSGLVCGVVQVSHFKTASAQGINGLHVVGNQLVAADGKQVTLRGVDKAGSEYACVQGWGSLDGPTDQASVNAMRSWNINAVRVPLNEDCWLNINGAGVAGSAYQQAITNYTNLLTQNGIAVVLDLHWNAPGGTKATTQQPMADQDHAPAFWTSVANAFKNNGNVLFDLYNEPYPNNNQSDTGAWTCLRDGCTEKSQQNVSYQAVGMQSLVNTVRATGATNVIMVGGVQWAGTVNQWAQYKPNDPLNNLAVSQHSYPISACTSQSCWQSDIAPLAAKYPVIMGEVGALDGTATYMNTLLPWLNQHGVSYLGWTWSPSFGGESLLKSYDGTPSHPYGEAFKAALQSAPPPPVANATNTAAPAASATNTQVAATAIPSPSAVNTVLAATASPSPVLTLVAAASPSPTSGCGAPPPPTPPTAFQPQVVKVTSLFSNKGISDDANASSASLDDLGYSYSASELATAGLSSSAKPNFSGIPFDWSGVNAGVPDNVVAGGQVIPVSGANGATKLSFLGSATHGPSSGTVTITYSDGTVQKASLGLSDWTLNSNTTQPSFGNTIAASTNHRNLSGGSSESVHANLYLATEQLQAGKTVSSITLPASVDQGAIHIFAVTLS
ncbi:MAG: hypothetical protein JWO42_419 [Chloroflexi bacterium]|jgi:hypothetical protein|nr:hypothetical protein [Chloroflexota bacterium]